MIAIGALAERGRLGPALAFVFIWTTIVYDPIAYWTWNKNGWSDDLGVLDFAGGTPVHISSGTAALAISIYLPRRRGYGTEQLLYKPHNTTYVILGTVFLWFGWFGFNGGALRITSVYRTVTNVLLNSRVCLVRKPSGSTGCHCH
jgi:Amt family ammonium transporter